MEARCPACNSDRTVAGRIGSFEGTCHFELPPQDPGFWATLGPRVELNRPVFLCVDCGTAWTQVDRDAALKEIVSGGSDELLERLRLTAPRKRRWSWLLLGKR